MSEVTPRPLHPLYERLFMRVSFAWLVLVSTPDTVNAHSLPAPNGFARVVDLTFLTDPGWLTACHAVLLAALGLYVVRVLLWLAMPVALFINVAVNAVVNSQGAIHHAAQIVSLVLLVQTVAYFYEVWRARQGLEVAGGLEERQILWSQQVIAAVYFVAGLTKLIETNGAWILRARFIGVQIFKTAYQAYYNDLDPMGLEEQVGIAQFAAAHGTLVALIAGMGLLLELLAPLMVLGRRWGLIFGCSFVAFHLSISAVMQLTFVFHQLLVLIYIVSPPYWIVAAARALGGRLKRPIGRSTGPQIG